MSTVARVGREGMPNPSGRPWDRVGQVTLLGEASRLRRAGLGLFSFFLCAGALVIGTTEVMAQTVDVHGQVRSRYERTDPAGPAGGGEGFVSMRVRASIDARLEGSVRLFLQLQDVRLWGEETSTLGDFSADNIDLHQGWVELGFGDDDDQALRVGRQEISFGGQRLVGAMDWVQQGRSFDGVRAMLTGSPMRVDLIGLQLRDESTRGGGPETGDVSLFGAYAVFPETLGGSLDVYGLLDRDESEDKTRQFTTGARLVGSGAGLNYRLEGTLQTGERDGDDVSAWMFGARASHPLGDRAEVALWFDHLSGDDDPSDGEVGVFSTLYATNHKFYGYADLFTNIPAHTGGLGLQDLAVKGKVQAYTDMVLGADLHFFRFAEEAPGQIRTLGKELDLTGSWAIQQGVTLSGGVAAVFADDGLAFLGRLSEDRTFFYLMLDAVF